MRPEQPQNPIFSGPRYAREVWPYLPLLLVCKTAQEMAPARPKIPNFFPPRRGVTRDAVGAPTAKTMGAPTQTFVNDDKAINRQGRSGWVFRILGNIYHLSGALTAPEGTAPSYSQLYIYDPATALVGKIPVHLQRPESTWDLETT
ncbi:hypothetical protein C8R43DRAFT_952322 [Mycena crocata]|nr:hypothetical protein C8R43DRAFT_952322 [Mycena crocata]